MIARVRGNGLRLAAFAGLTGLVAWRYAGVEVRPPTVRVGALGAIAVVVAALMVVLRGRRGGVARTTAVVVLLVAALLAAGVPARLLAPAHWGALGRHLHRGLDSIGGTLWPYSGADAWTRVDLILVLAVALIAAAAMAFWPMRGETRWAAARARMRWMLALAVLLAVYVLGLLDSDGGSVAIEGLLLLALIAAWLWPPRLGRRRSAAAVAWLAGGGALAALVITPLTGGQAWLGYRGWNLFGAADPRISFTWDQTYGPLHWSRSERTMFTVSAPRPELWKTTTLDRFDGIRFVRSAIAAPGDHDLPLPLNAAWYQFVQFTIADLRSRLLPVEPGVTAGVRTSQRVDYGRDGTVTEPRSALPAGATYTALSYVPDPSPTALRTAPSGLPPGYGLYTQLQLPGARSAVTAHDARLILASPYGPMYRLAHRLARGRRNAYDIARAIDAYLRANAAYEEKVPVRRYPLESFLFTDRVGYCQQFSGAMALMLRMDGIPARIAAGFLPGHYDAAKRQWVVRAVDAHSWVEVYFSGIGWVPFNPTPPRGTATPPRAAFASERTAAETRLQAIAATVAGLPRPATSPVKPRRRTGGGLGPDAALAMVAAVLLGSLAVAARWLGGWVRLRGSLRGDGELATRELVHGLRRLGYAIPATVTLSRIEAIVRLHGGPEAARYVSRLRDRRYGPSRRDSATLADRRRLRHGLTGRLGLGDRLRGLWALPPGTVALRLGPDHRGGP